MKCNKHPFIKGSKIKVQRETDYHIEIHKIDKLIINNAKTTTQNSQCPHASLCAGAFYVWVHCTLMNAL